MQKLSLLFILLMISLSSSSQNEELPEFNFENYSFPKAVVVNVENKTQEELKKQLDNWVSMYYDNSTLKEKKFSNNTMLISGQARRLLKVKNLTTDLFYHLKISLRENKYRMEISSISYKYYTEQIDISNINLIKDKIIKRDLEESKTVISSFFKDLNLEFYRFLSNTNEEW